MSYLVALNSVVYISCFLSRFVQKSGQFFLDSQFSYRLGVDFILIVPYRPRSDERHDLLERLGQA